MRVKCRSTDLFPLLSSIILKVPVGTSLAEHCDKLKNEKKLPTLEELIKLAESLVKRFMSQDAYQRALSKGLHEDMPENLRPPTGDPWNPPLTSQLPSTESTTKAHIEEPGFDGDRVLANSILFLMEYGWWIEVGYAIPDGDIGRFWEIMKVSHFLYSIVEVFLSITF